VVISSSDLWQPYCHAAVAHWQVRPAHNVVWFAPGRPIILQCVGNVQGFLCAVSFVQHGWTDVAYILILVVLRLMTAIAPSQAA
jgi:hypothetical protein